MRITVTCQLARKRLIKVQSIQERHDSVEKLLDFEFAAFLRYLHDEGNKAAISKFRSFSTKSRRSYIHYILGP